MLRTAEDLAKEVEQLRELHRKDGIRFDENMKTIGELRSQLMDQKIENRQLKQALLCAHGLLSIYLNNQGD